MPEPAASPDASSLRSDRVDVAGVAFDGLRQADVVALVEQGWSSGQGGLILTPNVDIWRLADRDAEIADLVAGAEVVVADGQPLVWASRLSGRPLPERVTGSGLVEALCASAARQGERVFIVGGGGEDTAERAATALRARYAGLEVAGHVVPPFGFERDATAYAALRAQIIEADPRLVLVGLGFPKQERLAGELRTALPAAWFLGCGGGVAMAAGIQSRSPAWAQRLGVEWVFRMVQEPRRLGRRYLVDDVPAAIRLLARSAWTPVRRRLARAIGRSGT